MAFKHDSSPRLRYVSKNRGVVLAYQHKGHSIDTTSIIESRLTSRNPVKPSEIITI